MMSSTDSNRLVMLAAGSLLAVFVSVAGAGLATASPEDCDAGLRTRPDVYKVVTGGGHRPSANEQRTATSPSWLGSSFNAYGRSVQLRNGGGLNFSYAVIAAGFQMGDQVWIDRSLRGMPGSLPDQPVNPAGDKQRWLEAMRSLQRNYSA